MSQQTDEVFDCSGQHLEDWSTILCKDLKQQREMNLSSNRLHDIPAAFPVACPSLELLNLNNNPLAEEMFSHNVDQLARLPHLRSLFLTLTQEEQVDMILKKLPLLETLNGLEVDREELEDEDEEETTETEEHFSRDQKSYPQQTFNESFGGGLKQDEEVPSAEIVVELVEQPKLIEY